MISYIFYAGKFPPAVDDKNGKIFFNFTGDDCSDQIKYMVLIIMKCDYNAESNSYPELFPHVSNNFLSRFNGTMTIVLYNMTIELYNILESAQVGILPNDFEPREIIKRDDAASISILKTKIEC